MEMSGEKVEMSKKNKKGFFIVFFDFLFFFWIFIYTTTSTTQLPKVDNPSRSLERSLLGPRFLLWLTLLCHHSRWWYTQRHTSISYHWIQVCVSFFVGCCYLAPFDCRWFLQRLGWFFNHSIFLNGSFNRWRFFVDKWLRLLLRASRLFFGVSLFSEPSSLFFLGRPRDFFFSGSALATCSLTLRLLLEHVPSWFELAPLPLAQQLDLQLAQQLAQQLDLQLAQPRHFLLQPSLFHRRLKPMGIA